MNCLIRNNAAFNFLNFPDFNLSYYLYLIMMPQHLRLLSVFPVLIFIFISCNTTKHSKSKRLPGTWQATPIVIDGKNTDWPAPYPFYDDKAMLGYSVSNDKENLYITVETGDLATQLKILRNGLTVWIDRKGGKDEQVAINFPIPTDQPKNRQGNEKNKPPRTNSQPGQGSGQDRQRLELEDKVRAALGEVKDYSLQGFKACNFEFSLLEKDTCGIIVRIDMDKDNELVWEAVIPFKSFYFKTGITRVDKGKPLSICIETTGSEKPAGQQGGGGNRSGGMRPSMGYGGMGMGMHMGGGGRRGYNDHPAQNNIMEPLYKSTKTWKKFGIGWQE